MTLHEWLMEEAIITWNRIGTVRSRVGIRISETTLTENLVAQFYEVQDSENWPVDIQQSTKEAVNGDDLEIVFETNAGFLTLACQCKIVGTNLKYNSIGHVSGGKQQIEKLLDHGKIHRALPIYLFYNYCPDQIINATVAQKWNTNIEQFGIAIADAHYIYGQYYFKAKSDKTSGWIIPGFDTLNTIGACYPFFFLNAFYEQTFLSEFRSRFRPFYTHDRYLNFTGTGNELFTRTVTHKTWKKYRRQGGAIGRIDPVDSVEITPSQTSIPVFAPKYRVIFYLP